MATLRKADIVRVLRDNNVDFDEEATVVQLRPLYDEVVNRIATQQQPVGTNQQSTDENVQRQANNLDEQDLQQPDANTVAQ